MDQIHLQFFSPLIVFILIAIAYRVAVKILFPKLGQIDYEVNKNPLTDNELEVYFRIKQILPPGSIIIPQVNYDKILKIKYGVKSWQIARNKIDRKSLDYVVFRESDFLPLLAIELDDRTHLDTDRQKKDSFENEIFQNARLNMLRIKFHETDNVDDLKSLIVSKLIPLVNLKK